MGSIVAVAADDKHPALPHTKEIYHNPQSLGFRV